MITEFQFYFIQNGPTELKINKYDQCDIQNTCNSNKLPLWYDIFILMKYHFDLAFDVNCIWSCGYKFWKLVLAFNLGSLEPGVCWGQLRSHRGAQERLRASSWAPHRHLSLLTIVTPHRTLTRSLTSKKQWKSIALMQQNIIIILFTMYGSRA